MEHSTSRPQTATSLQSQQPQIQLHRDYPPPILTPPRPITDPAAVATAPSTPTGTTSNLTPISPTYSYISNEPGTDDVISVEPRIQPSPSPLPAPPQTSSSSTNTDSRRSRAQLSSAFFEELEDIPAQEAQVRRMSVRRLNVPVSGESLRGTAARGRGGGDRGGSRASQGGSSTRTDWQREQREWEEMAEAVMVGGGGAGSVIAVPVGGGEGGSGKRGGIKGTSNGNSSNGIHIITDDPLINSKKNDIQTQSPPPQGRNLSWETGDDSEGIVNNPSAQQSSRAPPDNDDGKSWWKKFFSWVKRILIIIYALNIVAWGGMLFLLLINAAPAMCHPSCNHINSPRRKWVEIDSQILNGLFCVTGFGLIPWRFRDLYLLMRYRFRHDTSSWEKLIGKHHSWGGWVDISQGRKFWKVDLVVHLYCLNTYFQAVLAGLMWGMNRYNRPAGATGGAVAAACLVAIGGGAIEWWEGRKAKKASGSGRAKGRPSDGGESGIGGRGESTMSQVSRITDREEEEAKTKEAGLI